ncbi:hypothetical protein CEXT_40521 [Caerostris extrusa]|uniref:Uncharacterized protein n=1 Tax=Caerostris extrusa TaxID=172846 RepID=A0AAV4Y925_CAEEX|nr:hypothetical protein CEXT_40521 [Caerostris extrusa]
MARFQYSLSPSVGFVCHLNNTQSLIPPQAVRRRRRMYSPISRHLAPPSHPPKSPSLFLPPFPLQGGEVDRHHLAK